MKETKDKKLGSPLQEGSGRLRNKRNRGGDSSNCSNKKKKNRGSNEGSWD